MTAFAMLRYEDRGHTWRATDRRKSGRFWKAADRTVPYVMKSLRRYVQRDFHPDEHTSAKVESAFAEVLREINATPLPA
jgi:predicted metal-dependent hydrolase